MEKEEKKGFWASLFGGKQKNASAASRKSLLLCMPILLLRK